MSQVCIAHAGERAHLLHSLSVLFEFCVSGCEEDSVRWTNDDVDSLNASIAWLEADVFNTECLPVESLDFGLLTGDVVPRDGFQRPVLTSGSPVRARASRRDGKQPVRVTHVHQTVIQTCAPVAVAVALRLPTVRPRARPGYPT